LISRRARLRLTASPITETIGAVIGVSLLWVGGLDVLVAGTMSPEDFIRFILILFSVLGPIRLLSNVSVDLQKGAASAQRVFAILDQPPEIIDNPNAIILNTFSGEIDFPSCKIEAYSIAYYRNDWGSYWCFIAMGWRVGCIGCWNHESGRFHSFYFNPIQCFRSYSLAE
jgi:ABC-type multidrug transport system fused ATPase/permease subunit